MVTAACSLLALGAAPALGDSCPNAQYRTGYSAYLPDCRAYELVTPADKAGATDIFDWGVFTGNDEAAVSSDGNSVLLGTLAKYLTNVNPEGDQTFYRFSRSSTGWQITSLKPPGAPGDDVYQPLIWAPNLSDVAVDHESQSGAIVSYEVGPFGGPYSTVATPTDTPDRSAFVGATPDFSHVLFESTDGTLTSSAAGTVAGFADLYDYTGGRLTLVNVATDGSLVNTCGANLGGYQGSFLQTTINAISSDGSKIFFESPDPFTPGLSATCPQVTPTQLYMRDTATGNTIEVSAPQGIVDPDGPQAVTYLGAAADGSKVFFQTTGELTPDDAGLHDVEIYEYDVATGKLTRVTAGSSGSAAADLAQLGSEFEVVVSGDGSSVYFASSGQLTSNAPAAPAGYYNFYRYDTDSGATTYIATAQSHTLVGTFDMYATANGQFLLFDSTGVVGGPANAAGQQVYRFDSTDGSLTCVSCRPDGSQSQGDSFVPTTTGQGPPDVIAPNITAAQNPISANGQYVFFDSNDELAPQDSNGLVGVGQPEVTDVTDVYEWEADGSGSCARPSGCVYLLSSGEGDVGSGFLGASADGSNVFIATHSQLVPADTDQLGDIYDVRIDGGFPAPTPPAQCSGDGCQGGLSPAPSLPTAASVSFSGPGDASARPSAGTASVITHAVRGTSFAVAVHVSGGGRVTISGAGIGRVSRTVGAAGTYRLRVTLNAGMRRGLARRRELSLALRVSYAPPGASTQTVGVRVTVRPALPHPSTRARHSRAAGHTSGDAR